MATIEKIILHNFKSFKKTECQLGSGVIEITGPNGSGKSNVIDALRFVMGELNMKSLRAKGVLDLINEKATQASVTLVFSNPKAELKRAINREGKVFYRLNGERVRRADIENFLYTVNLDPSFYNIIPQGQVQKIVEMEPKKRRELMDSLAGISEYEDKKKESLRELETVQNKLNEATLIMNERSAYLDSLQKEKEIAEKYIAAKDIFNSCRMSIIKIDIEAYKSELDSIVAKQKEIEERKRKADLEFAETEKRLRELEQEKTRHLSRIEEMSEKEKLQRKKTDAESEIKVAEAMLAQLAQRHDELTAENEKHKAEREALVSELDGLEKELMQKSIDFENMKKQFEQNYGSLKNAEKADEIIALQNEESVVEKQLEALVESKTSLTVDIASLKSRLRDLEELVTQKAGMPNQGEDMEKVEILLKEKTTIENKIKKLFDREKELNSVLPDMDRKILELKDKLSDLRVVAKTNAITDFAKRIKERIGGIHGFVHELIEFEDDYSEAVAAAGGGRLNYLVVDDIDKAKEVFDILKREKIGRITCIPLKDLEISERGIAVPKEAVGFVKDFVKAKDKYRKAVEFVFGNTLLVQDMDTAKRLKGKGRLATLTGELLEQSGIITGGFARNDGMSIAKLDKMEKELNDILSYKKNSFQELQNIRQEMNVLRQRRSELDIKVKEYEVTQKLEKQQAEKSSERIKIAEQECQTTKETLVEKGRELEMLELKLKDLQEKRRGLVAKLNSISIESAKVVEKEKEKGETMAKLADLRNELANAKERKRTIERSVAELDSKAKESQKQSDSLAKERKSQSEKKDAMQKELDKIEKRIEEIDELISKKSSAYKKLEDEYSGLAASRGKLMVEKDRAEQEFNKNEIRKAQVETKYKDLVSEVNYEQLEKAKTIDLPKAELERMIRESEKVLNEHGATVNMKAPELYAERAKGVLEAKERIEKLGAEREAVMKFIAEIEEKKRDIFINTFAKVNENFRKLLSLIFSDSQGYLELDKPNSPFESGLYIKVIRDGRKRSLESLSGGEKSMLALLFILSMHSTKTAPFYVFDEADAALDKENSKKFGQLVRELAKTTQILVITHNDLVLRYADKIIGVTKGGSTTSELYGIKVEAKPI